MSWEQAFQECADSINRHELTMKITNELFPLDSGELWVNWIGLDRNCREQVYTKLVELDKRTRLKSAINNLIEDGVDGVDRVSNEELQQVIHYLNGGDFGE